MEISDKTIELARKAEENIQKEFKQVELVCEYNSLKVLKAFQKNNISDMHFNGTTGYGYGDIGRDTIERVFAEVLEAEDSLVRTSASTRMALSTLSPRAILYSSMYTQPTLPLMWRATRYGSLQDMMRTMLQEMSIR